MPKIGNRVRYFMRDGKRYYVITDVMRYLNLVTALEKHISKADCYYITGRPGNGKPYSFHCAELTSLKAMFPQYRDRITTYLSELRNVEKWSIYSKLTTSFVRIKDLE